MSERAEELKSALLELPEAERLEIADFIYETVAPPGALAEGAAGFDAMLARRLDDLESGRDVGIPAEQVMKRLREKYAK